MVAEHVQPTTNSQTALNQSLGIQPQRDSYQTMGITRVFTLTLNIITQQIRVTHTLAVIDGVVTLTVHCSMHQATAVGQQYRLLPGVQLV